MILARRIGAAVLTLLAVVVWFAMAPDEAGDRSGDISQALAEYELNDSRTQGAPQQQVVNGWVTKDLLTVIARQQNDSVTDDRLPALVGLLVLGVAVHLATTPRAEKVDRPLSAWTGPTGDTPTPPALD